MNVNVCSGKFSAFSFKSWKAATSVKYHKVVSFSHNEKVEFAAHYENPIEFRALNCYAWLNLNMNTVQNNIVPLMCL